jgi:hypothetical protein
LVGAVKAHRDNQTQLNRVRLHSVWFWANRIKIIAEKDWPINALLL